MITVTLTKSQWQYVINALASDNLVPFSIVDSIKYQTGMEPCEDPDEWPKD